MPVLCFSWAHSRCIVVAEEGEVVVAMVLVVVGASGRHKTELSKGMKIESRTIIRTSATGLSQRGYRLL